MSGEGKALRVRLVFGGATDPQSTPRALGRLLNLLVDHDCDLLRTSNLPGLHESGVRYQRENYTGIHPEDWRDIVEVLRRGGGDCEDLAAYRTAELRVRHGELARCVFSAKPMRSGGRLFHILVERHFPGSRVYEDPSRALGMGTE